MTAGVISRAKEMALNNDHKFHVAAALYRRKSLLRIGVNTDKTHPQFHRTYSNGDDGYTLHAEMDVVRFAKPGDRVFVLRWDKSGERTMAKPCPHCMRYLYQAGIREVHYSDWDGKICILRLTEDEVE